MAVLALSSRCPTRSSRGIRRLEGEDAERGKPIGRREREQFRNQITKQNDDREDDRGDDPLRDARSQRAFPDEEETEDDERNVHERVGEQENVEHAARIVAENLDELLERRMLFLEPPELMGLEGKERGLESGEKRRTRRSGSRWKRGEG